MNMDQFEQLLTLDESEILDFKKTFYVKERYVDLLTDVSFMDITSNVYIVETEEIKANAFENFIQYLNY
ncbi:hypothetical protein ACQKII_19005 [Lysinibacillus sp. NPDC048646]|uniref:hypothetical protein n=1 Tax=Lysinibacillus sp. NPDC048646 TaxID=3390574 RepID=UPI003CFCD4F5